ASGYVRRHLVEPGAVVAVGEPIAWLSPSPDDPLPDEAPAPVAAARAGSPRSQATAGSPAPPRVRVSPVAKKRARELGLPLVGITGSGPGGRILLRDVEAAAARTRPGAAVPSAPAASDPRPGRAVPLDRVRAAMAVRMTRSAQTIPQFSVSRDVDVTELMAWRADINRHLRPEQRLSLVDFIVQAVAQALQAHPYLNASFVGEPGQTDAAIVLHDTVNIGLATATPAGLLVPVLLNCQDQPLLALASARRAAVQRAMEGRLNSVDLEAGTFTISNLGPLGADGFTAMVNPPQAAILAVGRASERAVVRDGAVAVRTMMSLTVTADHRVVDGAAATAFLLEVARRLQTASDWILA